MTSFRNLSNKSKNSISNYEKLKQFFWALSDLNRKVTNYQVVDLSEYYNFDMKFVFIRLDLKMLWILLCYAYF